MKQKIKLIIGFLILVCSVNISLSQKILDNISDGNIDKVKKWLSKGKDLNKKYLKITKAGDSTMVHPIYWASVKNKKEILLYFVENLDRFENKEDRLNEAFGISIHQADLEIIKILLEKGADINLNCKPCFNSSLIAIALRYGRMDVYQFLREKGADINQNGGYNAIHGAAEGASVEILKSLIISDKLDVNEISSFGNSPLCIALSSGNIENAKILIEHGADLSFVNSNGFTLMNAVVESGNYKATKWFIDVLDEEQIDRKWNKIPLILEAVKTDNYDLVQLILTEYPLEKHAVNDLGQNAYFFIFGTKYNTKIIFDLLVDNQLDSELVDNKGYKAADFCKSYKRSDIKKMFDDLR